jgi:hypothetical protein
LDLERAQEALDLVCGVGHGGAGEPHPTLGPAALPTPLGEGPGLDPKGSGYLPGLDVGSFEHPDLPPCTVGGGIIKAPESVEVTVRLELFELFFELAVRRALGLSAPDEA